MWSCGGDDLDTPLVDRPAALPTEAVDLTLEEAGLLASGELFDIYDLEADPVLVELTGEVADLGGQPVWQLDIVVDVTDVAGRAQRRWRMWVGTAADGPPAVLRAREHR